MSQDRLYSLRPDKHLVGFGLVAPFRRDRRYDFATAGGDALIRARVRQVLLTEAGVDTIGGEVPWRQTFGSRLHTLLHMNNDVATTELARLYVIEALDRWEPLVKVSSLVVTPLRLKTQVGYDLIQISLVYDVLREARVSNVFALRDVAQDFDIQRAA